MSQRFIIALQLLPIVTAFALAVGRVRVRLRRRPGPDVARLVFDDDARWALEAARGEAVALGAPAVRVEHLLLALLADVDGGTARVLTSLGVDRGALRADVASRMRRTRAAGRAEDVPYAAAVLRVLEASLVEAHALGVERAGTEHLLAALAREGQGPARRALARAGVSVGGVREAARPVVGPVLGELP